MCDDYTELRHAIVKDNDISLLSYVGATGSVVYVVYVVFDDMSNSQSDYASLDDAMARFDMLVSWCSE